MCFSGINPIVFALFAQVKAKAIFSLPTIGHHSNSRVLQRMSSSGKGFRPARVSLENSHIPSHEQRDYLAEFVSALNAVQKKGH